MAVGSQFTTYLNPLLAVLKSLGGSARSAEAKAAVADHLGLSDAVLDERLPSGSSRFENQVSWARYYLVQSGFIDASRRGVWALTEKGRSSDVLTQSEITKLVQDVVAEWKASRADQDADSLETVTMSALPMNLSATPARNFSTSLPHSLPQDSNGCANDYYARLGSSR